MTLNLGGMTFGFVGTGTISGAVITGLNKTDFRANRIVSRRVVKTERLWRSFRQPYAKTPHGIAELFRETPPSGEVFEPLRRALSSLGMCRR
ncbi:hypothetical protein IHQ71_16280 [Rhizobium sp. TH2]|uniref:hypothetical protein n=1 Tax=Rhizobium sp. TH2 TaxID=2775403 RepID=UPI0021581F3B|nr:hypothetical protein [Rhizobium sp. TH2]UVC06809.1 hypothetical protein IHQ71_16280 [Rhizobium sp. TH2]